MSATVLADSASVAEPAVTGDTNNVSAPSATSSSSPLPDTTSVDEHPTHMHHVPHGNVDDSDVNTATDPAKLAALSEGGEDEPADILTPPSDAGAAFLRCQRERITVSFNNIEYTVQVKDAATKKMRDKTILQGISGRFEPGQLIAVMGASGSGKTSFLNILAGRVADYDGDVFFNGETMNKRVRRKLAYVQQDDVHFATLTPREHLRTHALLRMDSDISREEKLRRVDDVIAALGLKKCENSIMGSALTKKGISGGEARRVTFATELLTDPSVMFVDEPTSGLDAFMAEQVVHTLKDLARSGRTIICTIHQPSSDVYDMFDKVMYLAEGRVAYFGDRSGALSFFGDIGYPCPELHNPADWFIKVLSLLPYDMENSKRRLQKIVTTYADSELCQVNTADARRLSVTVGPASGGVDPHAEIVDEFSKSYGRVGWFRQVHILMQRSFLGMTRDKMQTIVKLMQSLIVSVVAGLIFLRLGNDQKSVQDKNGALFFVIVNQGFTGIFSVLQVFPLELVVFRREYQSGMYRVSSYYLARSLSEVPFHTFGPILFAIISYWMIGFRSEAANFFIYMGVLLVATNSAVSLGLFVSTMAPTISAALALGPLFMLPFMILGGLFINSASVPNYLIWLQYLSFFKYGYEALLVNQWTGQTVDCSAEDVATNLCKFHNGEQVLSSLHPSMKTVGSAIGCLFALMFFFRYLAYLFLLKRAKSLIPKPKKVPAAKKSE